MSSASEEDDDVCVGGEKVRKKYLHCAGFFTEDHENEEWM
jgi:hypothetical protein